MSTTLLLLLVATLPVFILLWYFWHQDKGEKEPLPLMRSVFWWGIAIVFPIAIFETFLQGLLVGLFPNASQTVPYVAVLMYLLVALPEEAGKLWVVKRKAYDHGKFNEVMDGITYAIIASMGFAVFENILYTFEMGLQTGVLRAFTAVPAHALFSGIMGYYVGLAKFTKDKKTTKRHFRLGLFLAVFFHGSYNFLLSTGELGYPGFNLLIFPLLLIMWLILHKSINIAHNRRT